MGNANIRIAEVEDDHVMCFERPQKEFPGGQDFRGFLSFRLVAIHIWISGRLKKE